MKLLAGVTYSMVMIFLGQSYIYIRKVIILYHVSTSSFFIVSRFFSPNPQQSKPHHLHGPYLKQHTLHAGTQHTQYRRTTMIVIAQNISPIVHTVFGIPSSMPDAIGTRRFRITPQIGVSNRTVARNPQGMTVHTRQM